jgi:hypothetical protein
MSALTTNLRGVVGAFHSKSLVGKKARNYNPHRATLSTPLPFCG